MCVWRFYTFMEILKYFQSDISLQIFALFSEDEHKMPLNYSSENNGFKTISTISFLVSGSPPEMKTPLGLNGINFVKIVSISSNDKS